jgi:hypothetical protein
MTIDAWLELTVADAERRGLPEMKPLLEGLAAAMRTLRRAAFNDDARGTTASSRSSFPSDSHA